MFSSFNVSINDYYNDFFSRNKLLDSKLQVKRLGCPERFFRFIGSKLHLCDSTRRKCAKVTLTHLMKAYESSSETFSSQPKFFLLEEKDQKILEHYEKGSSKTLKGLSTKIRTISSSHFASAAKPLTTPISNPPNPPKANNKPKPPVQALSPDEIWKQNFKTSMLNPDISKVFPNGRLSKDQIQTLVKQHEELIAEVLEFLRKIPSDEMISEKFGDRITMYPSQLYVFKINAIPQLFFKIERQLRVPPENVLSKLAHRAELTDRFQQVLVKHNLDKLYIQNILYVDNIKGEKDSLLVEEALPLEHCSISRQEELYELCAHDRELKPIIEKYLSQFMLFLKETGFMDIKFDNIPLLKGGIGIGLIDLDSSSNSPLEAILQATACLFPEQFHLMEKELKGTSKEVKIKEHQEKRNKLLEQKREIDQLIGTKQLRTGEEILEFDPYADKSLSPDDAILIDILLKIINERLQNPTKGLSLRDRRHMNIDSNMVTNSKNPVIKDLISKMRNRTNLFLSIDRCFQILKDKGVILRFDSQTGQYPKIVC